MARAKATSRRNMTRLDEPIRYDSEAVELCQVHRVRWHFSRLERRRKNSASRTPRSSAGSEVAASAPRAPKADIIVSPSLRSTGCWRATSQPLKDVKREP